MKTWYRHPILITIGFATLALAITQITQLLLYSMLATVLSSQPNIPFSVQGLLALLPSIIATLAGGAFLGRLRPDDRTLWGITALIIGLFPVVLQLVILSGDTSFLSQSMIWYSALGALMIWVVGCLLGSYSNRRYPDSVFDKKLILWSCGIVGLVIVMFATVWASVNFSKGYQQAKKVTLKTPPFVELLDEKFPEPGVAKSQRFRAQLPAGDTSIQEFYLVAMETDRWINVTNKFQEWPAGEWQYRRETYGEQVIESQVAGAHWQDMSGSVAVTMVLQALKVNPDSDWGDGQWLIQGVILSRGYSEPEAPIKSPDYITESDVSTEEAVL